MNVGNCIYITRNDILTKLESIFGRGNAARQ